MTKTTLPLALAIALLAAPAVRAIDIKILRDKTVDLKQIKGWTWSPEFGQVKMLLTAEDNPEAAKQRYEPMIVDAITTELTARGYPKSESGADIRVTYYVLISADNNEQVMGQFLPANAMWGLPPFAPQTTSIRVIEKGSLVIDLASIQRDMVIWRGIASAEIDRAATPEKRTARIRSGIKSLVAKLPKR
jgi:hypothetical protein